MPKLRIKSVFKSLVLSLAFIGLIMIAGNFSLAVNREAIDRGVSAYFSDEVKVGPAYYIFPNSIVLNDITLTPGNEKALVFPKMSVRFFLWDLLFVEGVHISDVTLYASSVNFHALSRFLEDNYQKILEIIRNSPGNDLDVRVKPLLLDFDKTGKPDYIATELALKIRGDHIEAAGYVRADQYSFDKEDRGIITRVSKGWPLWFKWRGNIKMDGLGIEHLILKSDNMYAKFWGDIRNNIVKANGFLFMDSTIQNSASSELSFSKYLRTVKTDHDMPNIDTYILDIDGLMHLKYPEIEVSRLNFNLNNAPVSIKGIVSAMDHILFDGVAQIMHPKAHQKENIYFRKADVTFRSTWKNKIFNTSAKADIDFVEHKDLSFSPEKGELIVTDLKMRFDRNRRAVFFLSGAEVAYWTNDIEHRMIVDGFKLITDSKEEGLKVAAFHAPFYGGILDGEMRFDTTEVPSRITSHIALNSVDTDALEQFLVHFAKFNGRLSSTMVFKNYPRLDLSGELIITDGELTDFNFFNWVSDSFKLPELKSIAFERASAQFSINKNDFQLFEIRLNNDEIGIDGYYDINYRNHVSSELTLALSKDLLGRSQKFKPVMKIFEETEGALDFDFRLSGKLNAVNFLWVPSEVKSKIQARIPDFIERKIERNIDNLMGTR